MQINWLQKYVKWAENYDFKKWVCTVLSERVLLGIEESCSWWWEEKCLSRKGNQIKLYDVTTTATAIHHTDTYITVALYILYAYYYNTIPAVPTVTSYPTNTVLCRHIHITTGWFTKHVHSYFFINNEFIHILIFELLNVLSVFKFVYHKKNIL